MNIDLGDVALVLGLVGGGGIIGLAAKVWSWGQKIEDAQPKSACAQCQRERERSEAELRAKLDKKADSESFIRLEAQVQHLSSKLDEVHADLRRLLRGPISRQMTPVPGPFSSEDP